MFQCNFNSISEIIPQKYDKNLNNYSELFEFPVKCLKHRCIIMLIQSGSETSVLNASDYTTVLLIANSYTMFFTYQWIRHVFHWGCTANSSIVSPSKTWSLIHFPPPYLQPAPFRSQMSNNNNFFSQFHCCVLFTGLLLTSSWLSVSLHLLTFSWLWIQSVWGAMWTQGDVLCIWKPHWPF